MAAATGTGLFCLGWLVRGFISSPKTDDTFYDIHTVKNLEQLLAVGFLADARVDENQYQALRKTIDRALVSYRKAPGTTKPCPAPTQALELTEASQRIAFSSKQVDQHNQRSGYEAGVNGAPEPFLPKATEKAPASPENLTQVK